MCCQRPMGLGSVCAHGGRWRGAWRPGPAQSSARSRVCDACRRFARLAASGEASQLIWQAHRRRRGQSGRRDGAPTSWHLSVWRSAVAHCIHENDADFACHVGVGRTAARSAGSITTARVSLAWPWPWLWPWPARDCHGCADESSCRWRGRMVWRGHGCDKPVPVP